MDEFTAEAFVNRGEPIPQVTVPNSDDHPSDNDDSPSRRHKIKKALSSSKLKEKLQEASEKKDEPSSSLQDRLFARSVIIPI